MKAKDEPVACPPGLAVLVANDGDTVIVSFALDPALHEAMLTPAESDVLTLVLAGCSNRKLAALRGVSTRTIANQIASLFRKLGVSSRLQLVTCAGTLRGAIDRSRQGGP